MELSAGTLICGRFELMREESPNTGSPVFGPTWAVLDTETGEPARACLLDASLLPGADERRAFVRAISELGDLRDPSLVPQVFVGEDGDHAVVCYDPLQAFALGDLYDGTGAVDVLGEAGRLAGRLARALALLHARGRVHGLLACETVFVGPQGPAAFQHGFAPLCARAELERRCRAFHVASLAFETRGAGAFTPAADVFGWGATLAQFVTGLRGDAALRAAEPAGLPAGLWALIKACLAEEPAARPRDGADLVRRLGEVLPGEASEAPAAVPAAGPEETPVAAPEPSRGPAEPESPASEAVSEDTRPASEADPRPRAAGKQLPVTSFEEMLLTSDRTHRPATLPPGALSTSAVTSTGPHAALEGAGRSASGLRRVHVLTEDAIVRTSKPTPRPASDPHDGIIGGTAAEIEAASKAPTRKLDPSGAVAVADAALAAAADAAAAAVAGAAKAAATMPPSPVTPPTPSPLPVPPPPTRAADSNTLWWVLAILVVLAAVALVSR